MPKTYTINKAQVAEVRAARKSVSDKKIDKRLNAVELRGGGMRNPAIAKKLDTSAKVVSRWISDYCNNGIQALMGGKYGGNRRNMSIAEEEAFLAGYKEQAESGQIVEVSIIEAE